VRGVILMFNMGSALLAVLRLSADHAAFSLAWQQGSLWERLQQNFDERRAGGSSE